MKKISLIFCIIVLIVVTTVTKNSTKDLENKIFTTKENIRGIKEDFGNIKLEHDYLSSAGKLLEFQDLYFDDELVEKSIKNIKIINKTSKNLEIKKFRFVNE